MTRYKLTREHFIIEEDNPSDGPVLHAAGTEVEWGDKVPTLGMEGIDEEGRRKCKERAAAERDKRTQAQQATPGQSTRIMDSVIPKIEEATEPALTRRRGR